MKEYIERDAALDCFHDWIDQYGDVHTVDEMPEYRAIEALPSVGRWIPCDEKIPEKAVLCCDVHGEIIIGCIYEDNGSDSGYTAVNDDVHMSKCVAWMPLPKPYKGDFNEKIN